jgi:hypothetical protein
MVCLFAIVCYCSAAVLFGQWRTVQMSDALACTSEPLVGLLRSERAKAMIFTCTSVDETNLGFTVAELDAGSRYDRLGIDQLTNGVFAGVTGSGHLAESK